MSEESNNEWENEGGSVLSSKMELTAFTSSIGYDQAAFLVKDSTSNKTSIVDEIVTNGHISKEEVKRRLAPSFYDSSSFLKGEYMNDKENFKLEKLHFRIDYSESLPQIEIENDTSMLHIRAPIQEIEELYKFIQNFLSIHSQAKKNQEADEVIILPYSGEK